MKAKITLITMILVVMTLVAMGLAHAAASAEEAARLGKDLTPWGAEKAGNKEGTIPAYTGGLPVDLMGKNWDSNKNLVNGRQVQPDPFKDEKPLYRITHQNLAQYADKLSDATKALFKNNPNFYMNVYPTHRTVNYPKFYLDASIKNATDCKLDEKDSLKGCKGGMPFPIPKTGKEAIINMKVGAFYGVGIDIDYVSLYIDRKGRSVISAITDSRIQYPFQDVRYSLEDYENPNNSYSQLHFRMVVYRLGPPRIAGEGTTLVFPIDDRNALAWNYQPGNRRVRATPNVEYDFPTPSSGGVGYYDEAYMFMGRMDKYDWKLLGKKEMIIPYSNYRMTWGDTDKLYKGGYPEPEYTRWELHRTWVVEATRKPGARHVYLKRVWYIDEDHPGAAMCDNYDSKGDIARGIYGTVEWIWDYQVSVASNWYSDINTGALFVPYTPGRPHTYGYGRGAQFRNTTTTLGGKEPDGKMLPDSEYTPEGLGRRSQR